MFEIQPNWAVCCESKNCLRLKYFQWTKTEVDQQTVKTESSPEAELFTLTGIYWGILIFRASDLLKTSLHHFKTCPGSSDWRRILLQVDFPLCWEDISFQTNVMLLRNKNSQYMLTTVCLLQSSVSADPPITVPDLQEVLRCFTSCDTLSSDSRPTSEI